MLIIVTLIANAAAPGRGGGYASGEGAGAGGAGRGLPGRADGTRAVRALMFPRIAPPFSAGLPGFARAAVPSCAAVPFGARPEGRDHPRQCKYGSGTEQVPLMEGHVMHAARIQATARLRRSIPGALVL